MAPNPHITKQDARHINKVIDRALFKPSSAHFRDVRSLEAAQDIFALSERIRRRATWQDRHTATPSQQIIAARDNLILRLYHTMAPNGWHCAWCDGSVTGNPPRRRCGIGGILMNRDGRIINRLSLPTETHPPFETEIAAVTAVMRIAIESGIKKLRVYSDCEALVTLWQQQRGDPRLEQVRAQAERFVRFQLYSVPRQHNQPANRLAREAASLER